MGREKKTHHFFFATILKAELETVLRTGDIYPPHRHGLWRNIYLIVFEGIFGKNKSPNQVSCSFIWDNRNNVHGRI